MADHIVEHHPNMMDTPGSDVFEFKTLSSHRDPLTRQTTEAVRIQQSIEDGTMTIGDRIEKNHNSK